MELRLALEGRLRDTLAADLAAGAGAVTRAMRDVTDGLKLDLRAQTVAAGLDAHARPGRAVSKTWQSAVYPQRGASLGAAGRVFSKFPRAMEAFVNGAVIRAAGARWLAVPAEGAGEFRNRKLRPSEINARLQFVPTRDPRVARLVLRRRGQKDVLVFWLFRQVRIAKRIEFYGEADKWGAKLPAAIVSEWENGPATTTAVRL